MHTKCQQTENYQNKIIQELEATPDAIKLFSEFEDGIIKKYFPTKSTAKIAELLHRTERQIRNRAISLGIRKRRNGLLVEK